jgi:hypothetical protein
MMQSETISVPKPHLPTPGAAAPSAFDSRTRWWLLVQIVIGVASWAVIVAAISLVV